MSDRRVEGLYPQPFPWRAVLAVDAVIVALLLLVARRYGYHRDELYFLEAGKHLAWGYVDQPPFTPAVAHLADWLAPGNLVVLRLFPAVAVAITAALGAAIAREFGATSRGQVVAALAIGGCGFIVGSGHLLVTAVFDITLWMALLFVTARMLRTASPRLWLLFGALAGVALLNKDLVVLLVAGVGAGLVVERRWDLLVSPWLAAGTALAALIALPNVLWQASHDWPQFEMAQALSDRLATENRVLLLPAQIVFAGPLLVVTMFAGIRGLWRETELRPFRALLWAWPVAVVIVFATGGRPYYVLPLTLVFLLVGIAHRSHDDRRLRRLAGLVVAGSVLALPTALPLLPESAIGFTAGVNEGVAETVGWPELADQVAAVVRDLPAVERAHVVLLTASYGEAGALDRFGPSRGLPTVYSAHNSYADFRQPDDPDATVVSVRYHVHHLAPYFEACEQVATVDNGHDVDNEVQGEPIVVCRGLLGDWATTWAQLRHLS